MNYNERFVLAKQRQYMQAHKAMYNLFSIQITFIFHIQGMFSLPGRGFHQRVTLISSVPKKEET